MTRTLEQLLEEARRIAYENDTYWVAVRKSPIGYDFYDHRTLSGSHGHAIVLAEEIDKRMPGWAMFNPVQRYEKVSLEPV